jgi:hypothetical protein
MNRIFTLLVLFFVCTSLYAKGAVDVAGQDTAEVIKLNKQAYDNRLTSPEQTVADAN